MEENLNVAEDHDVDVSLEAPRLQHVFNGIHCRPKEILRPASKCTDSFHYG
jgi:hypothetical protein